MPVGTAECRRGVSPDCLARAQRRDSDAGTTREGPAVGREGWGRAGWGGRDKDGTGQRGDCLRKAVLLGEADGLVPLVEQHAAVDRRLDVAGLEVCGHGLCARPSHAAGKQWLLAGVRARSMRLGSRSGAELGAGAVEGRGVGGRAGGVSGFGACSERPTDANFSAIDRRSGSPSGSICTHLLGFATVGRFFLAAARRRLLDRWTSESSSADSPGYSTAVRHCSGLLSAGPSRPTHQSAATPA